MPCRIVETESTVSSWNHWADVTGPMMLLLDPLGAGIHSVDVDEVVDSLTIDGAILAVIFDDENAEQKTVQLLFGAQGCPALPCVAPVIDTFNLPLAAPVADFVSGSRSIHTWVTTREHSCEEISTLRRALSYTKVILLLGFGGAEGIADHEAELGDLRW